MAIIRRLLLHEEVDVVVPHGRESLVRTLNEQQQTPETGVHLAAKLSASPIAYRFLDQAHSHLIIRTLLEPVHFSVAHVIVVVGQRRLAHLGISPTTTRRLRLLVGYRPIERECRCDGKLHGVAGIDGVDFAVVVEGEAEVVALAGHARDAVILLLGDGLDLEGRVEEEGVGTALAYQYPIHI